jgi:hypothetical protein
MKSPLILLAGVGAVVAMGIAVAIWPRDEKAPPLSVDGNPSTTLSAPKGGSLPRSSDPATPARAEKRADKSLLLSDKELQHDVETALAGIEAELDATKRDELIEAFVEGLGGEGIPGALAFLEEKPPTEANLALQLRLVRKWAGKDPAGAAEWATALVAGDTRQEAVTSVAIAWANRDFPGTVTWAEALSDPAEQQSVLTSAAYEAARTDPTQALTVAVKLKEGPGRDDLVKHATAQWAAASPEDAAAWAKQIGDPALRDRALSLIATVWVNRNPVAAAELASNLPLGRVRDDAVIGVVQQWVRKDPKAAEAWISRFPQGPLRETALAYVASANSATPR